MTTKTPREVIEDAWWLWETSESPAPVASAILSALTAAGYSVEQGWRPIETAPRDGLFLAAYADNGEVWAVRRMPHGFFYETPPQCECGDLTHWRPLPAPPAEKETTK